MEIEQFGNYATKKQIRELTGVRAHKNNAKQKWYFIIDESKISLDALKPLCPPEIFQEIESTIKSSCSKKLKSVKPYDASPATHKCSLGDLLPEVSEQIHLSKELYELDGDIIHQISNGKYPVYEMIDQHETSKTIRIVVNSEIPQKADLTGMRIRVIGQLSIYPPFATLSLFAKSIQVLGECSRITEIATWKKQYQKLFHSEQEQKDFRKSAPPFNLIGLISNRMIAGYKDFVETIYDQNTVQLQEVRTSKIDEIIQAIQLLNQEKTCQYICIVRGGGDPESLHMYSHPTLLQAISESTIPVITGIGHANSNLLCDNVAAYHTKTPTDAAIFFNKITSRYKYQALNDQTYHDRIITEYYHINWKAKCKTLEETVTELQEDNDFLNQEIDRLKDKLLAQNKRGLFKRIFNIN